MNLQMNAKNKVKYKAANYKDYLLLLSQHLRVKHLFNGRNGAHTTCTPYHFILDLSFITEVYVVHPHLQTPN